MLWHTVTHGRGSEGETGSMLHEVQIERNSFTEKDITIQTFDKITRHINTFKGRMCTTYICVLFETMHNMVNIHQKFREAKSVIPEEYKPTRCHLLLYCTSYRLNMFRALLCPSSGARVYNVDYYIGRFVL